MADPSESNLEDIFKQAQGAPPSAPLEVPSIAPPPGKKLSLALPIGLFLVVIIVGYFLLIPPRTYPEAGRRASSFLLAVGHQEYQRAWGMYTDAFKKRMPYDKFENLCAGDPKNWVVDQVDILSTKLAEGGQGVLVTVMVVNGFRKKNTPRLPSQYPAILLMVEEDGNWKVASIQF